MTKKHEVTKKTGHDLRRTCSTSLAPFDLMTTRDNAQRPFDQKWAEQILAIFDPDKLRPPILNHQGGKYWILDGQHGIWAAKQWLAADGGTWHGQKHLCEVYTELTVKEEADFFLCLNHKKAVSGFDAFRIALTAEWETETNINAIVIKHGLTVTRNSKDGGISCVGTLRSIYDRGDKLLDSTLKIAFGAFGTVGLESNLLRGIALVKARYDGVLTDSETESVLDQVKYQTLCGKAGQTAKAMNVSGPVGYAAVIVDLINAKRRKGSRKAKLASWWRVEEEAHDDR